MTEISLDKFLEAEEERVAANATSQKQLREEKSAIMRQQALDAYAQRDLKAQEVADLLGIHLNTVKRMLKTGALPGYRIGRRGDWRVQRQALDVFRAQGGSR